MFADVDPRTYNMTADLVAAKITPRTRALLPVHIYGQPVDMDLILDLARKHSLRVVEDASHAHGGIITTNNDDLFEKIKILRYVGQRVKFVHELIAFQERLYELQEKKAKPPYKDKAESRAKVNFRAL